MAEGEWVEVARLADLPCGEVRGADARGRRLALVNREGRVFAFDARCPHMGGPLDAGKLWQGKLECPWHHFLFDLETGGNVYPANVYPEDLPELKSQVAALGRFPVRVDNGRVFVQVPGA